MRINLHTKLDAGIYKSSGGGQDIIVESWAIGSRNLLKAIDALYFQKKCNAAGYGNIGCGASWLEINGVQVDVEDIKGEILLEQYIREDKYFHRIARTKTQIANDYLESITGGAK